MTFVCCTLVCAYADLHSFRIADYLGDLIVLKKPNSLVMALFMVVWGFQIPVAQANLFDMIKGPLKPVEVTESSDKAANFKEAFKPEGMFAKDPAPVETASKKVVIAGFQMEFATEQKAITKNAGSGAGLASTTEKIYYLKGAKDEQFQSITDKSYAAFVEHLKKLGYEVLPPTVLLETGYKEKFAKVNQLPVHHERGVAGEILFGDLSKIGEDKDEKGQEDNASVIATAKDTSPDVYSKFMAGFGPGFKAADALQANIIQLRLKVNFARFDGQRFYWSSGYEDKPQNGVSIRGTGMQVFAPNNKMAMYSLAKTVILPNRVAEKGTPIAASAGQTTKRASGGLFKALAGLATGDVVAATSGAVGAAHSTLASDDVEMIAGSDYETVVGKDVSLFLNMMTEALPK